MEEEQDRILLSTLGVQSANPEDIERHIFDKVFFYFIFNFTYIHCSMFELRVC